MSNEEDQSFDEQLHRFEETAKIIIGDVWRKPQSARLGYQADDGTTHVIVEQERTDQPFKYYFSEAGGTSFQGEAFLLPGALAKWQIKFNAPILIKKNVLNGEWEIIGIDSRWAAQFFDGSDQDDGVIISYPKLGPGLLTQTNPPSMRALVLDGAYNSGGVLRYHETQSTIDWTDSAYIPTGNLRQRYVLVQIALNTGLLTYKYGSEIASSLTPVQTYKQNLALGGDAILPALDENNFRCGYIRLIHGMVRITKANIWSIQDYLLLSGGSLAASNILDKIVTDSTTGEVVVDSVTGNVVYIE
jgi:hypothetical protein